MFRHITSKASQGAPALRTATARRVSGVKQLNQTRSLNFTEVFDPKPDEPKLSNRGEDVEKQTYKLLDRTNRLASKVALQLESARAAKYQRRIEGSGPNAQPTPKPFKYTTRQIDIAPLKIDLLNVEVFPLPVWRIPEPDWTVGDKYETGSDDKSEKPEKLEKPEKPENIPEGQSDDEAADKPKMDIDAQVCYP